MSETSIIIRVGLVCLSVFTSFGMTLEEGSPVLGNGCLLVTCKVELWD